MTDINTLLLNAIAAIILFCSIFYAYSKYDLFVVVLAFVAFAYCITSLCYKMQEDD